VSMSLEQQLKMRGFKSEYQKAHLNLLHTVFEMLYQEKQFFAQYDLTVNQYNVLRILRGQQGKPISIKDIRSRMLDRGSDVGRIVVRLEKKGFAKKMICECDRRAMDIMISEKGQSLINQIGDLTVGSVQAKVSKLTRKEAQKLNELLDKIRA